MIYVWVNRPEQISKRPIVAIPNTSIERPPGGDRLQFLTRNNGLLEGAVPQGSRRGLRFTLIPAIFREAGCF